MRAIRLYAAFILLRSANVAAGFIGGPELTGAKPRAPLSPAERILLGSLVGAFIAGLWIWLCARAGR